MKLLRSIRNFATLPLEFTLVFASAAAADRPTKKTPNSSCNGSVAGLLRTCHSLANYTCHEVVDRMLRRGNTWNRLDTIQFEAALVGRGGTRSLAPGEERFGERSIGELAPGTITNGVLGSAVDKDFRLGCN